jgi:hypothetical protein
MNEGMGIERTPSDASRTQQTDVMLPVASTSAPRLKAKS